MLSQPASEEALKHVFDSPGIEPADIDLDGFRTHPGSVGIPGVFEVEAALCLALRMAILTHTPQGSKEAKWEMVQAIVNVLSRLAKVHPGIALRTLDTIRDGNKLGFPPPGLPPGSKNLAIAVLLGVSADPYIQNLIMAR